MNYNNPRRGRSPPPQQFFYDDPMRPVTNQREYDNPYRLPPQIYGGPGRHYPISAPHPMEVSPMHMHPQAHISQPMPPHHSFIEGPNPGNFMPNFSEHYYDGPPPSNPYHPHMNYRDPRFSLQPNPIHPNAPRSSSPPYKILCITNINQKVGDGPVKDALISDFSRFGDISVSVCHDNGERLAYIYFRNCEDAREARQFKARTMFFDRPIEIEPIYEQLRGAGSPNDLSPASPMMPPSGLPVYSPRRRSMSPSHYQRDMTDTMNSRPIGPPQPTLGSDAPPSPIMYSQHRGPSPAEYCMGTPGVYPEDSRTPPSLASAHYERRNHHATHNNYRPSHITPPYSSPAHEQYRSSNRSPSNQSPYSVASPGMLHRERAHIPSRSPARDPYHSKEHRGQPSSHSAHHHHSSSRSSSSNHHNPHPTRQLQNNSSVRNQPAQRHHHNHPPDPPVRFTSRDYRRGKFGPDHNHEHDDSRPSRVLLINNIDASKTEVDLREAFEPFGMIEEMEIKKVASDISSALIKFSSMDGAYKAKTANNGRRIGNLRCRIVYGKVTASKRLWIGGLSPNTTVSSMEDECSRYGDIVSIDYTSGRPYSYVEYETANQAQFAAHHLRTTLTPAAERKIRIEFVDPERSEKLAPKHGSDSLKIRPTTESLYDIDITSPKSISGRKRSTSPPNDSSLSKRLCPVSSELPPVAASTFKQERLAAAAAAAAKARTNSTTSSLASHPTSEKSDKIHDINDSSELINKSDNDQPNNGDLSTPTQAPSVDIKHVALEAPSADRLLQCASIREIVHCCAVSWPGQIALRNFIFPAQLYMCGGQKHVIDRYLSKPATNNGDESYPLLRITQRWRLHPQPKLEEVKRRMQSGNLGMLIITARQENAAYSRQSSAKLHQNGHPSKAGSNINPQADVKIEPTPAAIESIDGTVSDISAKNSNKVTSTLTATPDATTQERMTATSSGSPSQSRPIRNLISYLEQKDAAGVVSLSANDVCEQLTSGSSHDNSSKLLYTFPPGEFALNLLKRMATNLTPDSLREEYLLGVIVGGNVDGGKV